MQRIGQLFEFLLQLGTCLFATFEVRSLRSFGEAPGEEV